MDKVSSLIIRLVQRDHTARAAAYAEAGRFAVLIGVLSAAGIRMPT